MWVCENYADDKADAAEGANGSSSRLESGHFSLRPRTKLEQQQQTLAPASVLVVLLAAVLQ
jgi:hypothetical protein